MKTETVEIRNIEFGVGKPKICVPIVERNREAILSYAEHALKESPDLLELRIDWFEEWKDCDTVLALLKELRARIGDKVLLFTMRTKNEGGEADISELQYQELCQSVCESGLIDMIDVEAFMAEHVLEKICEKAHGNGVYVVGSNHDFEMTPEESEMVRRLRYMDEHDVDIPKIAVMPRNARDVLNLLSATLRYREEGGLKPVITMSMGKQGVISRLAGETFGSAVTFATTGCVSAPGQISIDEIKPILKVLHFDK